MFADFDYYKNDFGGTKIKNENEYKYLAQQASKYIEKFTNDVNDNTKACECAISEYLQSSNRQGNMTSESIPNAYSVSWSANDTKTKLSEINSILELYLGDEYSTVGIVRVIN